MDVADVGVDPGDDVALQDVEAFPERLALAMIRAVLRQDVLVDVDGDAEILAQISRVRSVERLSIRTISSSRGWRSISSCWTLLRIVPIVSSSLRAGRPRLMVRPCWRFSRTSSSIRSNSRLSNVFSANHLSTICEMSDGWVAVGCAAVETLPLVVGGGARQARLHHHEALVESPGKLLGDRAEDLVGVLRTGRRAHHDDLLVSAWLRIASTTESASTTT